MREFRFRIFHPNIKHMIYEVLPVTVGSEKLMQYIGISDINNKPIYEGDILKTKWHNCWSFSTNSSIYEHEIIGEIQYLKEYLSYRLYNSGVIYELHDHHDERLFSIEVIGNIYEHPELLRELKS